jgi:hypothetical protein
MPDIKSAYTDFLCEGQTFFQMHKAVKTGFAGGVSEVYLAYQFYKRYNE